MRRCGALDMVIKTAIVIVGDHEERFVPPWAVAQRLVNVLEHSFSFGHVEAGVVRRLVRGRDPRERGERAGGRLLVE